MYLEINDHKTPEDAADHFSTVVEAAAPDMGLSYGWDMVTIRDKRVYHLHADCTLAGNYFNSMISILEQSIGQPDRYAPPSLRCRCGGGCRLAE